MVMLDDSGGSGVNLVVRGLRIGMAHRGAATYNDDGYLRRSSPAVPA